MFFCFSSVGAWFVYPFFEAVPFIETLSSSFSFFSMCTILRFIETTKILLLLFFY